MKEYFVKEYGKSGGHKTWGVYYLNYLNQDTLVCVCICKKGAEDCAFELNTLAEIIKEKSE